MIPQYFLSEISKWVQNCKKKLVHTALCVGGFWTIHKITHYCITVLNYTVPMILVSFRLSPTWLFCFNNSTRLIDNHSKTRIWQLRHMKSSLRLTIWYLSYGSCRFSILTRGTSPYSLWTVVSIAIILIATYCRYFWS